MTPTRPPPRERIIVALDLPSASAALDLADRLGPTATLVKVGLELYTAAGPTVVAALHDRGLHVFLDLKLHDIPNTVARAVARAGDLGVRFLTLHTAGGRAMLAAAANAAPPSLALLGVTVLTSLEATELGEVFGRTIQSTGAEVERLAILAREAGLAGVICAPTEAEEVRAGLGPDALVVTPGIRSATAERHDQRRVCTVAEALRSGASHIVVGRPVTRAPDPRRALEQLQAEAEAALAASAS